MYTPRMGISPSYLWRADRAMAEELMDKVIAHKKLNHAGPCVTKEVRRFLALTTSVLFPLNPLFRSFSIALPLSLARPLSQA